MTLIGNRRTPEVIVPTSVTVQYSDKQYDATFKVHRRRSISLPSSTYSTAQFLAPPDLYRPPSTTSLRNHSGPPPTMITYDPHYTRPRGPSLPRLPRHRLFQEEARRPSPLRDSITADSLREAEKLNSSLPATPIPSRPSTPPPLPPKDYVLKSAPILTPRRRHPEAPPRRPIIKLDDPPHHNPFVQHSARGRRIATKDVGTPRQSTVLAKRPPSTARNSFALDDWDSDQTSIVDLCQPTLCMPSPRSPSFLAFFERPAKSTPNNLILNRQFNPIHIPPAIPVYANRPFVARVHSSHNSWDGYGYPRTKC